MQMHLPRVVSAGFAILTLASCTEPGGLRLVLSVDRTSLVAQDSVKLSLELINQSDRTVKTAAPESYGLCLNAFQVLDSRGRDVGILSGFCIAALIASPTTDLLPGQSISITDYWHPGSSTLDGHAIDPGRYRVFGRVYGDGESVTSAPATITVLP
jgi:hypothetical protein